MLRSFRNWSPVPLFVPRIVATTGWCPFSRRFYGGMQQMLRGLVKKVLLADRLGEAVDVEAGPDIHG